MKELNLKDSKTGKEFAVQIPTKVEEITKEWLLDVTKNISIAPYHSLIALVTKDVLMNLLSKKKDNNRVVGAIPMFVKRGFLEDNFENGFLASLTPTQPIIIAGSDLAMGYHVNSKDNKFSPGYVVSNCNRDNGSYQLALGDSENIYLVEFKIIPNSAIHGAYMVNEVN